jgi:SAM-dependent methyltransferase
MKLPFLRKSADTEPLVVSMTGVKLGERALYCGASAARLAALAARTGLSGRAAILPSVPGGDTHALVTAATREGVLVDALSALDEADRGTFDLVVLDSASLDRVDQASTSAIIPTLRDALRPGGRLIVIEPGPRQGIRSRLGSAPPPDPSLDRSLADALNRVRTIGERDGLRFVEGFKAADPLPSAD